MKNKWKKYIFSGWCVAPIVAFLATTQSVEASNEQSDNVRLHGVLVSEPCVISPGDEEIHLDFGTVIEKYLYLNSRTLGQEFDIRLSECDLSLGQTVRITLLGRENIALPGLLDIDGKSSVNGIAIGLETLDSVPIQINKPGDTYPLREGNTVISLKAYVQGEPEAIAQRNIGRGPFSATATLSLDYE
ncbi:Fimbrial adapter papK precursor [Serratia marcescens]|uniref:fimbrial protein n=1 Tax=Serratia marcescens TaxID=615 RepID=UPI00217AA70D|nr:fimbrial protein [Serratia marcescens]CAI1137793.1 Fimbrial adapter papK precursor [Serratia marcescens]CAI1145863.1 Fimbrial adapter papK precursor [Serratia marcescens]CAI1940476.1 Fimbrial adapter papK precursor [Serratia marcescens]CAI1998893.1 Fimbrial adapter papK precursor [Serratia marcescens]